MADGSPRSGDNARPRAFLAAAALADGTIASARISVRLAVTPPARKKRRRTRPVTMTVSPDCNEGTRPLVNRATGTLSAGPSELRTVT